MTTQDPSEKTKPFIVPVVDKDAHTYGNLTLLAQVAAADHALTPLQAMRTYWRAFGWCVFMSIGALLCGFDIQIGGGLLSVPQFRADFGYEAPTGPILPASWQSAFNSASSIGSMFGGLALGLISDKLGRRGAIAVASVISIVAIFIQFFTPPHINGMLLVGKLVNGVAIGMYISCASTYCVEASPLALRGVTTSGVNLWVILGIFMSNGVLRGTGNRIDVWAYRLPFAFQWIFPVILLIGLPFAPESPWWLVRNGQLEAAERVIAQLGGPTIDTKLQLQQILETVELEDSHAATATYIDCFRGVNLKRTTIAIMAFVLLEASGVVFVFGYSTYFFELAGFTNNDAFNLGVALSAIAVVGTLSACYTVNRFGRRFLFSWGMAALAVVLLIIGFLWTGRTNQRCRWAISALMIIYTFVYEAGIGPVAFIIFAEVSSAKLRSKTVGIGVCVNSLLSVAVNTVIPYLVNPDEANLGGYVGFVFGGLACLGTVWAYFYIPETRGRTVDELDLLYEKRVPVRFFETYKLYDGDWMRETGDL